MMVSLLLPHREREERCGGHAKGRLGDRGTRGRRRGRHHHQRDHRGCWLWSSTTAHTPPSAPSPADKEAARREKRNLSARPSLPPYLSLGSLLTWLVRAKKKPCRLEGEEKTGQKSHVPLKKLLSCFLA